MKKCWLILLLAAVLSTGGCTGGQSVPEEPSAAEEKPAIYLYPEAESCAEASRQDSDAKSGDRDTAVFAKPAIYLAPQQETQVTVKLHYAGTLTCTYPEYRDGWTVLARPDGTLTDDAGREYNYLFWEGVCAGSYDMDRGFVVPGTETADFLEETLAQLGLTDREAGDFITYWLPRMQDNPYNLITFQTDAYTERAQLEITPEPDSLLRVFMVFQPLAEPVSIEPQTLPGFERKGFVAVEWGGCELGA